MKKLILVGLLILPACAKRGASPAIREMSPDQTAQLEDDYSALQQKFGEALRELADTKDRLEREEDELKTYRGWFGAGLRAKVDPMGK